MLWRIPSPRARLISDAPPWVMNGSGMPVIGMMPDDHPDVDDDLEQDHRGESARRTSSRTGRATASRPTRTRQSSAAKSTEQQQRADEPELLEKIAATKSVSWTGRKFSWFWVPFVSPLPNGPPEPDRDLRLVELIAGALDVRRSGRGSRRAAASGSRAARRSRRAGARPDTPPTSAPSQRRLAPDMNSMPTRIATEDERGPEVRLHHHEDPGRRRRGCRRRGSTESESEAALARPEVVGEHDDHQDLGELAELELERADRDPARRAADPVPIASVRTSRPSWIA